MGRIIGIDYGQRRVGIALTDPLRLIATPFKTVQRDETLAFLQAYLNKEEVDIIVVGMPMQLDARFGSMALQVKAFVRLLKRYFPKLVITTYDERFTSKIAQRSLLEAGYKKKKRQEKGLLDQISATLILQSFLNLEKERRHLQKI